MTLPSAPEGAPEPPDFASAREALTWLNGQTCEEGSNDADETVREALSRAESLLGGLRQEVVTLRALLWDTHSRMRGLWRHAERCTQEPCTCRFHETLAAIEAAVLAARSPVPGSPQERNPE